MNCMILIGVLPCSALSLICEGPKLELSSTISSRLSFFILKFTDTLVRHTHNEPLINDIIFCLYIIVSFAHNACSQELGDCFFHIPTQLLYVVDQ